MRREYVRALITSMLLTFLYLSHIGYNAILHENNALAFAADTLERTTWAQRKLNRECDETK